MRLLIVIFMLCGIPTAHGNFGDLSDKSVQKITEKVLLEISEKLAKKNVLLPEEVGIAKKDLLDAPLEEAPFEATMQAFEGARYRWELITAVNTVSRIIQQHCKTLFGDEKHCKALHIAQMKYDPQSVWQNWQNILKWYHFMEGKQ